MTFYKPARGVPGEIDCRACEDSCYFCEIASRYYCPDDVPGFWGETDHDDEDDHEEVTDI